MKNMTVEVCFNTVFFFKKKRELREVLVIALWQVQFHKYFPNFLCFAIYISKKTREAMKMLVLYQKRLMSDN